MIKQEDIINLKPIKLLIKYYIDNSPALLTWDCITEEDFATASMYQLKLNNPTSFKKEDVIALANFLQKMKQACDNYDDLIK